MKGARVKDRKTAERALAAAQREIDEGRVGIAKPKNITFSEWADVFEEILDTRIASGELHPRTKSSYASTLNRGRDAFGSTTCARSATPSCAASSSPSGSSSQRHGFGTCAS